MSDSILKYKDINDKCYGIAGMTIATVIFDCEKYLDTVSLDKTDFESVGFSGEFYFPSNSSVSPKAVWQHLFKKFQLKSGMLISNVVCRCYANSHKMVDNKTKKCMLRLLIDEGVDECQLEEDEIEIVFNKNYDYISRVFSSDEVRNVASMIASRLSDRRLLLKDEILEMLAYLR